MNPFPSSLRRLWMTMLPIAVVLVSGCLPQGRRGTPAPRVVHVSPEKGIFPAGATSAAPTFSPTHPFLEIGITVPTVTPPGEMATPTSAADLPVDAVPGARAPDFALVDLDRAQVSLSDLRGRPVLLNFWATW